MADLEKLLLEAAGRTSGSEKNRHSSPPSKRKHKFSYSDDGSDSKDDSDDDRGYSSRKPSGSQVPLKKRLDPTEKDDDHSSNGEGDEEDDYHGRDSDDDSVGSDLYKDEDDRKKLAQMTELEREMILEDRATKRSDKGLHEKFKNRKSSPTQRNSRGVRSSARFADRAAAKDDALNEIRAKRLRQQDPEAHRKLRDVGRQGSGGRGYSPVKRRPFSAATIGSPTRSRSASHSDEEDSTGDGGLGDSDEEKTSAESKWPTYEDIREITIRRSKLAKWFMEPYFEDLIVGCFVRVGIGKSRSGSIYRLCCVRNVDASDPDRLYKLDNKTTYKYLNCVWGNESSAARWQMAMISDSAPSREEFDQWVREVERSGGRMPSKQEVLEKKKEMIQKTNTYVYTPETVKQMLQEKKSATRKPLNVAAEKDRLRNEMEVAKMKNDEAEVERIRARLQELEASRSQGMDKKAMRLQEMNRKNRVENFKNASQLKPVNMGLKAGEAGYDPFSRRWTRSRNYYTGKQGAAPADGDLIVAAAAAVADSNGVGGASAEAGVAATEAALEAAADAGKLVDTSAPVDQGTATNTLHNFDLPISLAVLHKFGGPQGVQAGFMARKQWTEAIVGRKVPENDGRRHAFTLTVSDYKRRRDLL